MFWKIRNCRFVAGLVSCESPLLKTDVYIEDYTTKEYRGNQTASNVMAFRKIMAIQFRNFSTY
eukprot:scaffold73360_cov61-Cyclotella_meneghiniana.AAC.6